MSQITVPQLFAIGWKIEEQWFGSFIEVGFKYPLALTHLDMLSNVHFVRVLKYDVKQTSEEMKCDFKNALKPFVATI